MHKFEYLWRTELKIYSIPMKIDDYVRLFGVGFDIQTGNIIR